ncbi:MAG TPA: hypothetical protein VKX41_19925 [Alloacidobacterium sp.]|nr:hypothetical protein [Alloacidobacterium sp.]
MGARDRPQRADGFRSSCGDSAPTLSTGTAAQVTYDFHRTYEPDFIAFQQRLRAAGKPPRVVRITLVHKLLVRLNAKARDVRQQMATAQDNNLVDCPQP